MSSKEKTTKILCLVACLFLISSCADARAVAQEGQSSNGSEESSALIREVTEGQNFDEPMKFEVPNLQSSIVGSLWSFLRDEAPSSYIFRISNFSSLTKTGKEKFESGVFEAGGHKWRMIFYPNGNSDEGTFLFVSVYVVLEDAKSLSGDVLAQVRLFAYNQKQKKYYTVQEVPMTRFNSKNPVRGSLRFMLQLTFSGWFNEYVVNDNCALGAEIEVYDHPAKQQESISMLKISSDEGTFNWKIRHFDSNRDNYTSSEFVVGGRAWQLLVYPKGNGEEVGKSLSGFLYLADHKFLRYGEEVFVRGKLKVFGRNSWWRVEKSFYNWLNSTVNNWGFRGLVPLKDLSEYIVDGSLRVGVVIEEMSQTKYSP